MRAVFNEEDVDFSDEEESNRHSRNDPRRSHLKTMS